MQDYLMIGTVLKPQGIRGEVKIKPYAARVEMFSSWKNLYLEDRGAWTPVPLKVTRIHDGFVYAVLSEHVMDVGLDTMFYQRVDCLEGIVASIPAYSNCSTTFLA